MDTKVLNPNRAQVDPTAYDLDASTQAKLLHLPDRAHVEHELSKYPPATQRRWVANPALEFLLQNWLHGLTAGSVGASGASGSSGSNGPVAPAPTQGTQAPQDDPVGNYIYSNTQVTFFRSVYRRISPFVESIPQ